MKQTLQSLFTSGREALKRRGVPDPELDARYLLLEAFRTDQAHFLMNRSRELPDSEEIREMAGRYRQMIGMREKRIPLQQILGSQEFMGLSFFVNRHVLIPRQDTETLVELVLQEHPGKGELVLDLCTGTGCIAVCLAVFGHYRKIVAADWSKEALKVAAKNCDRLLGEERQALKKDKIKISGQDSDQESSGWTGRCQVELAEGDLFAALGREPSLWTEEEKFDILVSNPPYIPTQVIEGLEPEVRDFEPRMALDGTVDGLEFYRRIATEGGQYMKKGAALYLEIGHDQGEAVKEILSEAGWGQVRIIRDLAGHDRVAAACACIDTDNFVA